MVVDVAARHGREPGTSFHVQFRLAAVAHVQSNEQARRFVERYR